MRSKIVSVMCCMLMCFAHLALSQPQSLRVALPEDGYPPFIIIQQPSPKGILIETLQLAAHNIGLSLSYTHLPEKRSNLALDEGKVDARMESELWVNNPQDYLWSVPITQLDDVFVFNQDAEISFETDSELNGAQIITHLGYSYPDLQPMFDKGIVQRSDFSNETEMLSTLIKIVPGLNRAAVMNMDVARWIIKSSAKFQGHFTFSQRTIGTAPLQFQFIKTKGMQVIVEQLNIEINKLKENGTVDKITRQILDY
jgi:polar amino acid transport system substrate-binding protein